jgi:hypothetical protein
MHLFDGLLPGLGGKSIVGRRRSVTNVTGIALGERHGLTSIEGSEQVTDKTSDLVGFALLFLINVLKVSYHIHDLIKSLLENFFLILEL